MSVTDETAVFVSESLQNIIADAGVVDQTTDNVESVASLFSNLSSVDTNEQVATYVCALSNTQYGNLSLLSVYNNCVIMFH